MTDNRAAITGYGVVSGFGCGVDPFWDGLLSGKSAATQAQTPVEALSVRAPSREDLEKLAGEIKYPRPGRSSVMCQLAALEAWNMAGLKDAGIDNDRAGIVMNRNFGQHDVILDYYKVLRNKGPGSVSGLQFVQSIANTALGRVAMMLKLRGASLLCFGPPSPSLALDLVRDGTVDLVLAGCADELSLYALSCLTGSEKILENRMPGARPYAADRAGLVPGEGAAFFVIENVRHAKMRDAPILAYLEGWASVQDREGSLNPLERNTEDLGEAFRRAIADGGTTADQVGFVSGAANGGIALDAAEMAALSSELSPETGVFSVKGAVGETWGASGGMSLLAALLALRHGRLPSTACTVLGAPAAASDAPVHTDARYALAIGCDMSGQDSAFLVSKAS
jgi:3-oxoacyl-[acyl-carrier-protein] synthase II